jgi:P27 family predicted phage terminase small subunit
MGRNKKPSKLKKLEGTYRSDRVAHNEMEVPEVDGLPEPPTHLNRFAKDEWLKQTGILSNIGMLAETDMSLLLAYCIECGKYFELVERLKGEITFNTPNGHIAVLPEVTEANKALQNMIKMSSLFGFNPASRTKITMPEKPPKDILEDFD